VSLVGLSGYLLILLDDVVMIRIHACLVRVLHSILYIKEITINPVVLLASVIYP
jgi:hypothetical protein